MAGCIPSSDHSNGQTTNLSYFNLIPDEVMMQIFGELDFSSSLTAGKVCKRWHVLIQDNRLWIHFLNRDVAFCNVPLNREKAQETYKKHVLFPALLSTNLSKGVYQFHQLGPHDVTFDSFLTKFVADNGKLVSYTSDRRIEIWDLNARACLHSDKDEKYPPMHRAADYSAYDYRGSSGMGHIILANGKMISNFYLHKNQITILDTETFDLLHTLDDVEPANLCSLISAGSKVIAVFRKGLIKIWDVDTGVLLQTLNHEKNANCLFAGYDGGKLVASYEGPDDGRGARIWDVDTGTYLPFEMKRQGWDYFTVNGNGKFIRGCRGERRIEIWDIETRTLERKISVAQELASLFCINEMVLSAVYEPDQIVIWDINTGKPLGSLPLPKDGKNTGKGVIFTPIVKGGINVSLFYAEGHFIAFYRDYNQIQIWDIDKRVLLRTYKVEETIHEIAFTGGKLILGHADGMLVYWDFGAPSPFSFSQALLEENLRILEKIDDLQYEKNPEEVKKQGEALDPRLRQRLEECCLDMIDDPFPFSTQAILHVRAEICVELLLHAIYAANNKEVQSKLKQLENISKILDFKTVKNNSIMVKLYQFLCQECDKEAHEIKWAQSAFWNDSAPVHAKAEAVLKFREFLKAKHPSFS